MRDVAGFLIGAALAPFAWLLRTLIGIITSVIAVALVLAWMLGYRSIPFDLNTIGDPGAGRPSPSQGNYATAFDYPVGDLSRVNGRRSGTGGSVRGLKVAEGWRVEQDFKDRKNYIFTGKGEPLIGQHLGEDWNLGSGSDDALQGVYAIADGIVTQSEAKGSYGHYVMVRHALPPGSSRAFVVSFYGHLSSRNLIAKGSRVKRGDRIGLIGEAGDNGTYVNRDGIRVPHEVHLHFELRVPPMRFRDDEIGVYGYSADSSGFENPTDATSRGNLPGGGWIDGHR